MRVTHRLMETTIAACLGTALLLLSSLPAVAGQPGGPDYTPGFYRVTPVDRNSRASDTPQMLCHAAAPALLRLVPANASGGPDLFVQPGTECSPLRSHFRADRRGRAAPRVSKT